MEKTKANAEINNGQIKPSTREQVSKIAAAVWNLEYEITGDCIVYKGNSGFG